jgi:hypothetical protein
MRPTGRILHLDGLSLATECDIDRFYKHGFFGKGLWYSNNFFAKSRESTYIS